MISYYVDLTLRVVLGTIAGAVKFGPGVLLSLVKGERPPPYNAKAVELGAPLLRLVAQPGGDASDDFSDDFIDVTIEGEGGVKLHAVVDAGRRRKEGKRPIVFVHGFPECWVSWHNQMQHFAKAGHPVLALDMRGYGQSDKPREIGKYHLYDCLAMDIKAVIEYATNDLCEEKMKPLLVAHDWGASVCWAYVCNSRFADSVVGYVALTLPPGKAFEENMTLKQAWNSLYILYFNMPWLPEKCFLMGEAWMIGIMMNQTKRVTVPSWLINTYRANVLQAGAMEAQLNYYRSAIQQSPKPEKGSYGTKSNPLPLPTLIMRGMDDFALGEDLFRNLDLYLKNNKLVALENCSHWMQADCPDEVNSEIESFLEDLA